MIFYDVMKTEIKSFPVAMEGKKKIQISKDSVGHLFC